MDRTGHSQVYNDYPHSDTLFDSHLTRATQPPDHEDNWFAQQKTYSRSVLASWGLPLGELPYSHDNQQTLRSLVELISFRQKDLQFRSKCKQDIAALTFQKDKYCSFMEQTQRNLEEVTRKLGCIQNEASELRRKEKKNEMRSKKQRDEDKKMIAMIKAKNEQVMHEIKKKEQEVNRIKEQMKKSVGQKSVTQARNSFEVFQGLSPLKREQCKQEEVKYALLLERNEREINDLVRENAMLRENMFGLREALLDFNEWVDRELFGEGDASQHKRTSRFLLNHNLLFKKESLVDEFGQLLEVARDGIKQLRELSRGGGFAGQKKVRSSQLLPRNKEDLQLELNFKKKFSKQEMKTERSRPAEERESKPSEGRNVGGIRRSEPMYSGNFTPRSNQIQSPRAHPQKSSNQLKNFSKGIDAKQWDKPAKNKNPVQQQELPFEDVLLSEVMDEGPENCLMSKIDSSIVSQIDSSIVSQIDSSIVSQIEVGNIGKGKFDKWDILYQDDE